MQRAFAILVLAAGCVKSPEPDSNVRIIRGVPGVGYHDLTVEDHGLESLEGATVEIQIGIPDRPPERLGHATTTITGGAFSVRLPGVMQENLYVQKVVWIDANRDGVCDAPDRVYEDASVYNEDWTWDLGTTPFLQFDSCELRTPSWPTESNHPG